MPGDEGLVIRPCTSDDAEAVLRLAAEDEERVNGRPCRLTVGDLRDWWQSVKLESDSWLVLPPGSDPAAPTDPAAAGAVRPVAVTWLDRQGGDLATWFPIPDVTRRDLLPLLADLAEARAEELALHRFHAYVLVPDAELEALLRGRGYDDVRHFYDMAIALHGPQPPLVLPEGFTLTGVGSEDGRAFHAAITEAFEDHWEHHGLPFEEWWRLRVDDPAAELPWWFVIREGGEIAAAVRSVPDRNGGVYVASLGVRRPWRGRGLGKALLRTVFDRAWSAGYDRVTLGVDAASPTGATLLYRGVGMVVESESAVFERVLRD